MSTTASTGGLLSGPEDPAAPDGRLRVRSTRRAGATDRWLVQPPHVQEAPHPFSQWVEHIKCGTRATENVRLGLDLSALMEAAYRSAASGSAIRLDEIGALQPAR